MVVQNLSRSKLQRTLLELSSSAEHTFFCDWINLEMPWEISLLLQESGDTDRDRRELSRKANYVMICDLAYHNFVTTITIASVAT